MSVNGSLEPVQTLNGKAAASPYIPQRMANKLKLTGTVEAEYDGSAEVEVEIPAESDPTVPAWAKAASAPVTSVNGRKGAVYLSASDVGALSSGTYIPSQTSINHQIETKMQSYARRSEIPAKLPNPNRLTFTGAVNAVYDGTTAVNVKIPTGGSGGGGNWNQNNPSGAGYIKNRTHWVETVTTRDISVEFPEAGESVSGLFSLDLVEGETYEVTWDGVLYSCVAYIANGPNTPSIGNAEVANASGGGNGEPFFCTVYQGRVMLFASTAGTHTISMPHFEEYEAKKIHKLDGKYLPDGIGYFGVEMASYVCDGEQIPLYGFPVFAAGDTVVITVDGVEQSFVALEDAYGQIYIGDFADDLYGNPQYGWEVLVGDFYENDGSVRKSVFAVSVEKHTFSYPAEVVHKIDPKCMPDIVLTSPNGTKFILVVDNNGTLSALNPDAV